MDDSCQLCGAPVEVAYEYHLVGAGPGPPGTESIVVMQRVECATGHFYDRMFGEVQLCTDEESSSSDGPE